MPSGRWRCTACSGFLGILWVGVFAAGYPTGLNNVESSHRRPARWAWRRSCRSASCRAGSASFILKKLNLLRVPVEVELEGLDMAEYETDFYPEHARAPEEIVEPDGTLVPAELLLPRRAGGA